MSENFRVYVEKAIAVFAVTCLTASCSDQNPEMIVNRAVIESDNGTTRVTAEVSKGNLEDILENQIYLYLNIGPCSKDDYYPAEPMYDGKYLSSYQSVTESLKNVRLKYVSVYADVPTKILDNTISNCIWFSGSSYFGMQQPYSQNHKLSITSLR